MNEPHENCMGCGTWEGPLHICADCGQDYPVGNGHLTTDCIVRLKADLSDMTDDRNQWVAHWNAAKTAYSVAVTERDQFEAEIERLRNTPCFECGHS